jgi:hypothetical protein
MGTRQNGGRRSFVGRENVRKEVAKTGTNKSGDVTMLEAISLKIQFCTVTDVVLHHQRLVNHSRMTSISLMTLFSDRDDEKTLAPDANESISNERREGPSFGSWQSTIVNECHG